MGREASEQEVLAIGRAILAQMDNQSPSIFKKDYWQGQIMEWSMKMPAFKVEMFRFVDVLPVLHDSEAVARHIQEYFCRPEQDFPSALQWGLKTLKPGSMMARLAASQIEKNVVSMARSFIAGEDAADALGALRGLWKREVAFTVDLLGEATVSEHEARDYERRYLDLIENLANEAANWKARPNLERDAWGEIPRVNVSIKLSSLYSQIQPAAMEHSVEVLKERLRPIFRRAKALGVFLNLDLEHYALKEVTLRLFKSLMEEAEFAGYQAGCVIQAYLRDSEADLKALIAWARASKRVVTVRLVKGAYWDYETIHAQQMGWPVPVFTDKGSTDANYERLSRLLLENADVVRAAFASHNVRSLAYAIGTARALGLPDNAYEMQMLYGMAEPLKAAVQKLGFRLREYVPVGQMIPGMAYLVRRLLENTSNESWLRHRFVDGATADQLLAAPRGDGKALTATGYSPEGVAGCAQTEAFYNEAPVDFAVEAHREAMRRALAEVEASAGALCPVCISNKERPARATIPSLNPANPAQVIAQGACASTAEADEAVAAALRALPAWRDGGAGPRIALLRRAAALMRQRRAALTARIVLEAGKGWESADADVAEAIDFLEYYAREMARLEPPRLMGRVPGEHNHYLHQPRGVVAVIAPWNFPLAILAGMAAAALVTGNCALLKPAEQTPSVAWAFFQILREAGLPEGVAAFVPGRGEEVGAHLVKHPQVDMIAFTGSLPVGQQILREAAEIRPGQRALKKVVVELGGKNAIIVDSDADLDMAVQGVIESAFGFQGQKCSACSRVILIGDMHDAFVERLAQATRSLPIGAPRDPRFKLGPVIDAEALERIQGAIARGRQEATLALACPSPEGGFYVGPHIFTGVRAEHWLAREEIFGPVLAVMRAADFEEALALATGSTFALTGGLYSRSPLNIARAREAFRVGNLYINRGITGALVERHAFGGGGLSGLGTKAGGPEYLQHFMVPRVITENTMRRGFAPEDAT
jgi:RHH-type proline utilization regulon transcriptional repressor/proline dehydrogenase/delta 1-pyrroline-5-carboxylate dehydrogenase